FDRLQYTAVIKGGALTIGGEDAAAVLVDPAVVALLPLGERGAELVRDAVAVQVVRHAVCRLAVVLPGPALLRVGDAVLIEEVLVVEDDERHVAPGKGIDALPLAEWGHRDGEEATEVGAVGGGHERGEVADDRRLNEVVEAVHLDVDQIRGVAARDHRL